MQTVRQILLGNVRKVGSLRVVRVGESNPFTFLHVNRALLLVKFVELEVTVGGSTLQVPQRSFNRVLSYFLSLHSPNKLLLYKEYKE